MFWITGFFQYAIGLRFGIIPQLKRGFAKETHEESHGCKNAEKHDSQNDSRIDPAQLFSDDHPDAVGLSQTNGPHETQYRKDSADGSGPQAERLIMDDQRPEANQEKNPSHQQSKRSELGGIGGFLLRRT